MLFAVGDEAMELQDDDDGREIIEQLKEKFNNGARVESPFYWSGTHSSVRSP